MNRGMAGVAVVSLIAIALGAGCSARAIPRSDGSRPRESSAPLEDQAVREDGSGSLSILVLPIEGTIGIGGTVVFLALLVTDDRRTVVPNLPWTETVWASSDQSVATIVNGTATGLRLGSTKITAKYRGLTSSEVPLTVKDKQLSYILLEPPQAEVVVGGTRVFWVSARYADQTSEVVTDNCTWTLSDPEVARMEQGVVTGIKSGMTDIEVEYQGQKDSARLWVQGP